MAKKGMRGFDVLADLAVKFVERQKGVWDHTAWLDFLLDVQKAGFELSKDTKTHLGSVLESMMKLYNVSTNTENMQCCTLNIFEHAAIFFMKTRGAYDPSEWEAFLKDLQKKGVELSNETRSYLEKIFELSNEIFADLLPKMKKAESKETSPKRSKEGKTG